ncbi:MAG TPA: MCE family protein [Sulfurovum sp.]|nr:MCE family protein [Sulfurovum sp.]
MSKQLPEITESSKFNLITSIWIVPFIALLIAAWLAYQYFADRGPEIKIIFPKNEGLVAGQSVVKFKNVPIGKVTKIYIQEDIDGVVVVVRMNTKASRPYMTEYARFWIVKPEVGLSGVSGLDTLISGTYIDVYSKKGGTFKETHFGLTQPYNDSTRGEYFVLRSLTGKNVSIGTPVYYKNIKVGQVQYVYLSLDNHSVDIVVFIDNQYVPFVHEDSKFWRKNMINVDFSKGNLDIDIAPLNYMLAGGIVFSSTGETEHDPVSTGHVFPLYKSETEAEKHMVGAFEKVKKRFMLHTDQSVANLAIGSLVRFDGFDIGRVIDVKLSYNKTIHTMTGDIILEIDTSVFKDKNESNTSGLVNFYQAVEEGLRAKIASLDPITGVLFVDLTFAHQDGAGKIGKGKKYALLPMASNSSSGMMDSIGQILDTLNNLPLDKLLASLTKVVEESAKPVENANILLKDLKMTVKNINRLTSKKSFEVLPDELNKALKEMTKTLKSTTKVVKGYDSNSLLNNQLSQTLEVLTKTSQEMQVFLKMLNRKPNSLIFGDN